MLIYHEKQEASLCGQHCLNNLLQGPYFTAFDLSEIALELDDREKELMMEQVCGFQKFYKNDLIISFNYTC